MSRRPPSKTILIVAHDIEKSGAPRVAVRMAAGLQERGWRVAMCFPARGGCEEEARAMGLKTWVVDNPAVAIANASSADRIALAWKRLTALVGYWRLARRRDVGLVWCGSYVAVIAGIAGRMARKPVVYHIHEDVVPTRLNKLRADVVKSTARALVFVARKSVAAFKPKPRHQEWLLLPNFLEPLPSPAPSRDVSLRTNLNAPNDAVVYLTAAFLTPRKGIDVLLRAFKELLDRERNVILWIAGDAPPTEAAYARQLKELAREPGIEKHVRFLGHRDDIPQLMASADVFVLASRNEALPLTIAEAMRASLPVVATDVGSVRDMVADGRSGRLVPPDDATRMAEAMASYAGDPGLRRLHGTHGKQRSERLYDQEHVLDRVEAMLHKMT